MTARQAEILDLVAEGLGDKEVARKLGISTNTVRTHLQRVYRNQQVPNRAAAASFRVEERAQSPSARALSRSATVIGTLMAIAALLVGGPRVVGLASALLAQPASTAARAPASTKATPPARPAAGAPTPARQDPVPSSSQPAPTSGPPVSGAVPAFPRPAPGPLAAAPDPAHEELVVVNQERASSSLPPLSWNDCLARVAAGDASKLTQVGTVPPPGGEPADLACAGGQPVEIFTFWSSVDDVAVSRILFANASWRAALLGAHSLFGAAWAPGVNGSYLVIEIV